MASKIVNIDIQYYNVFNVFIADLVFSKMLKNHIFKRIRLLTFSENIN